MNFAQAFWKIEKKKILKSHNINRNLEALLKIIQNYNKINKITESE